MEGDGRDVVGVALQGVDACFRLVVPDLGRAVVGTRDQVGAVAWVVGWGERKRRKEG